MKSFLISLSLLIFLGACASAGGPGDEEAGSVMKEFKQADLQAALQLAEADDDQISALCWRFLLERISKDKPKLDIKAVGPMSIYQKGRSLRRRFDQGTDINLRINCAPMAFDSADVLISAIIKAALRF